jgi:FG-GAP repeat
MMMMMMRRAALVVLLVLLAAMASPVFAESNPSDVTADFNNDGFADLAVGVPAENGVGAVNVLYGTAAGLSGAGGQVFSQVGGAVEGVGGFGSALAAEDFNNDEFADLAVGAPNNDVGSALDAGAVSVLYGSADGLTTQGGQLFTQVGGAIETGDTFGFALAAGDFNNNGFADLAVGAPGESVGGRGGAGAVSVLQGSAGGLTSSGGQLFTQVGGAVEGGDTFGFALAAGDFNNNGFIDLAAGAPFETVGSATFGAGAVSVLQGSAGGLTSSGGQLFTQVGGAVERGDLFGWAVAAADFNNNGFGDLTAGAPFEDVSSALDAGAVSVLYGSAGGLTSTGGRLFTQVGGLVESVDHFGSQLAAGDFNNNGPADLAAAAPAESIGSAFSAGAVSVLYGSGAGLTISGGQLFTQNTPGIPGVAEPFDQFGGVYLIAG